jgi:hypothetical protein
MDFESDVSVLAAIMKTMLFNGIHPGTPADADLSSMLE